MTTLVRENKKVELKLKASYRVKVPTPHGPDWRHRVGSDSRTEAGGRGG